MIFGHLPRVIKGNLAQEMKVTLCNDEKTQLLCCQNTYSQVCSCGGPQDTPPGSPCNRSLLSQLLGICQWTAVRWRSLQGKASLWAATSIKVMRLPWEPLPSSLVITEQEDLTIWPSQDNPESHCSSRTPGGDGQGSHWPCSMSSSHRCGCQGNPLNKYPALYMQPRSCFFSNPTCNRMSMHRGSFMSKETRANQKLGSFLPDSEVHLDYQEAAQNLSESRGLGSCLNRPVDWMHYYQNSRPCYNIPIFKELTVIYSYL